MKIFKKGFKATLFALVSVLAVCVIGASALLFSAPKAYAASSPVQPIASGTSVTLNKEDDFDIENTTAASTDNSGTTYKVLKGIKAEKIAELQSYDSIIIEIPEGVEVIEARAFRNLTSNIGNAVNGKITSVKISSSVKIINAEAFYECRNLQTVDFTGATSLTEIRGYGSYRNGILNTSSTTLKGAFYNCTAISSLTIPDSVTAIGSGVFRGLSSLTQITLPFVGGSPSPQTNDGLFGYIFSQHGDNSSDVSGMVYFSQYAYRNDNESSCGSGSYSMPQALTTVTITGGKDKNNTILGGAFYGCTMLQNITLPEKLGTITAYTFYGCTNLTAPEIPASVTQIGKQAFYNCTSLTSFTLGDGVTTVGEEAFSVNGRNTSKLKTIDLKNVQTLGKGVFKNCTSLVGAILPDSVTSIGSELFYGCTALGSAGKESVKLSSNSDFKIISPAAFSTCTQLEFIEIPAQIETIDYRAFYGCSNLRAVDLSDTTVTRNIKTIGYEAFYNCTGAYFTEITFPKSLTEIGYGAFYGVKLNSIKFAPDCALTEIKGGSGTGSGAFSGCSITEITLPANLKTIGGYAFYNCRNLNTVKFEATSQLDDIQQYAFSNCSLLTSMELPASVTKIGNYAFSSCNLGANGGAIALPENLTTIGDSAFYSCQGISSVTLQSSVESIGKSAFSNCQNMMTIGTGIDPYALNDGLQTIGEGAFTGCRKLSEIKIPSSVTSFSTTTEPANLFNGCTGLQRVIFNCNVTSKIPQQIFYGCSALSEIQFNGTFTPKEILNGAFYSTAITSFTVPESVTKIEHSVFRNCIGLTTVTFAPESQLETLGYANNSGYSIYGVFDGCTQLQTLEIPKNCKELGYRFCAGCRNLTSVTFADAESRGSDKQITNIRPYAFNGCTSLGEFTIPSTVTTIGDYAFDGCSALVFANNKEHYLPENLATLGTYVFRNCTTLSAINIPKAFTTVSSYLFSGCTNLATVTFEAESITAISNNAFEKCAALETFTANFASTATIGASAFEGCTSLAEFKLPSQIQVIDRHIFHNCTALSSVYYDGIEKEEGKLLLPDTVTTIRGAAFYGCGFTEVTIPNSVLNINASTNSGENDTNYGVFEICKNLTTVNYNSALTYVSEKCFRDCQQLTKFNLPEDSLLTYVKSNAFSHCFNFTDFDFERLTGGDKHIGQYAFWGCPYTELDLTNLNWIEYGAIGGNNSLTTLTLPFIGEKLSTISGSSSVLASLFGNSSWEGGVQISVMYGNSDTADSGTYNYTYWIPQSLKNVTIVHANSSGIIPRSAFSGFKDLVSITLPELGYTTVRDYAFYKCESLRSLVIPATVTSFGGASGVSHVFEGCNYLESLEIPVINTAGSSTRKDLAVLFGVASTDTGLSNQRALKHVTISVSETLGENAFRNGNWLESITLPENMTSIAAGAFYGCTNLSTLTLPFLGLNADSSANASLETIFGAGSVPASLKEVILLGGLVGERAFAETSVERVTLPANLAEIGEYAFYKSKIKNITIPDGVTTLSAHAFEGCSDLAQITFTGNPRTVGAYAFADCTNLTQIELSSFSDIGEYAFKGCSGIGSVSLSTVRNIGAHAFEGCQNLTTVTLSTLLTSIEDFTFNNCVLLNKITVVSETSANDVSLPKTVTNIGESAFRNCAAITSIALSDSLKTIGRDAFSGNTGLRIIMIPKGVTTVAASAFEGDSALEFVYLPDKAIYGNGAFANVPSTALLIASDKAAYDSIVADGTLKQFQNQLTYLIPVKYNRVTNNAPVPETELYATEYRLYKKTFDFKRAADGSWSIDPAGGEVNFPLTENGYSSTVWRDSKTDGTVIDTKKVNELLSQSTAEIELYATVYAKVAPVLAANLKYGLPRLDLTLPATKAATVINYINANILDDSSPKFNRDVFRVVRWEYNPIGGGATTLTMLGNAGVYKAHINLVSSLGAFADDIVVAFTIEQKVIDLSMEWVSARAVAEGEKMVWQPLEDFEGGMVGGETVTKILNGMARGNGKQINVKLLDDAMGDIPKLAGGGYVYSVSFTDINNQNFATNEGKHQTTATLILNDKINYKFDTVNINSEALKSEYSCNVTIGVDGTATITKTWIIIGGGSGSSGSGGGGGGGTEVNTTPLVDENGDPWQMTGGWTYGDTNFDFSKIIPTPGYAPAEKVVFTLQNRTQTTISAEGIMLTSALRADDNISFTLETDSSTGKNGFETWINAAVPAGDYKLAVKIDANVNPSVSTPYSATFYFTVDAISLTGEGSSQLFDSAYEFSYNQNVQLPQASINMPESGDLRNGTGWADSKYDELYSSGYVIEYSVDYGDYMTEDDMKADALNTVLKNVLRDENGDVQPYTVYYRLNAKNFETVGGDYDEEHKFTVTIKPADNVMTTAYSRADWTDGESASTENAPQMLYNHEGGLRYRVSYYSDAECTKLYTDSKYTVGTYYVKIFVDGSSNFNAYESQAFSFTVHPKSTVPPEPTQHRLFGPSSPNGFSVTEPWQWDIRTLIITGIVVAVVILLCIFVLIAILALRAHRRRKVLFERIMTVTSRPVGYLGGQQNAPTLGYGPMPMQSLPSYEEEDPDSDGFYDSMGPESPFWRQYWGAPAEQDPAFPSNGSFAEGAEQNGASVRNVGEQSDVSGEAAAADATRQGEAAESQPVQGAAQSGAQTDDAQNSGAAQPADATNAPAENAATNATTVESANQAATNATNAESATRAEQPAQSGEKPENGNGEGE